MRRPASAARPGRAARSAVVLAAASTLLVGGAIPASAQTTAPDLAGATGATALTVTVNLPGGQTSRLQLILDPVTGTVRRVGSTTDAAAAAEVFSGNFGGETFGSGVSSAMLPSPLTDSDNQTDAFADGLAGSQLENLLRLELLPSSAAVSAAPSSTSEAAVANLGVGLPDDISDALDPLTEPLEDALDDVLLALADAAGETVESICDAVLIDVVDAIGPITEPLAEVLDQPVDELVDMTSIDAVCGLRTTITELNTALQGALDTLTGDSGVLGTGLITGEQSIVTAPGSITSTASASITDLTLLGQQALVGAEVLRTTSTAVAKGTPGSADATIDSTVAGATAGTADPFVQVRATIEGIRDSFVGEGNLPTELDDLFDDVFDTLNDALAPLDIVLFKNDDSPQAQALANCPTELNGLQTGTFEAPDGTCAAAATRGVGLSVTLPDELTDVLMIEGPLVELLIVPSAAVARLQVPAPVTPPMEQLPRTGLDSALLGGLGAVLLLGTVLVRRRRLADASI